MRRNKNLIITVVALLVIGGVLIAWTRMTADGPIQTWKDTDVGCLAGHQDVAHHIHPNLVIVVDGQQQPIPAETGIQPGCMAEIHTHNAGTKLHVETTSADRLSELTLADFFTVWGEPYDREGYSETLTHDGEEVSGPEDIVFEGTDGDTIRLEYSSGTGTSTATSTPTGTSTAATTTAEHDHGDESLEHSHE